MRKKLLIPLLAGVIVLMLLALLAYHLATTTTLGLILLGNSAPSSTLVNNLYSNDRDLVMSSLDSLTSKSDPSGQSKARQLLTSSDDYIWFNAALYLGAIKDQQAVPYLIKGLKHPAYRAYPDVVRELGNLTSQTFGMDQTKWIGWWRQINPGSTFSFDYASLQKQSSEITSGSNILINNVLDATTISYSGSPIRVIGVRVKVGVNPAQAQRVLSTAMLGQFANIQRDGSQLTSDGAVPALINWVPDAINPARTFDPLRAGFGPVPFTNKASLQKYLLNSGQYDLDLSTVTDPTIRAELQAMIPATSISQ